MTDWCRENPVLTFIVILVALGTVRAAAQAIWSSRRKGGKR